ncbi:MAG: hypothetical protein QM674_24070 [Burkholderiaceae bacterium]
MELGAEKSAHAERNRARLAELAQPTPAAARLSQQDINRLIAEDDEPA